MHQVCITGIGTILPGCDSRRQLWHQMSRGESQLQIEPSPLGGSTLPMGVVRGFDADRYLEEFPRRFYQRYSREILLYLAALVRARDDAELDLVKVSPTRIGLFDGVSRPCFRYWYDVGLGMAAREVWPSRELLCGLPGQSIGIAASLLGIQGPTYTYTSTCTSGAVAIGHALLHLQAGKIDVAFAGGHECSLISPLYATYGQIGLLSERQNPKQAVAPWGEHTTNAFGEGAVTLVLETRTHAEERGAPILATLGAYAYGNAGYHPTAIDGVGSRPAALVHEVLREAGVVTGDVSFVVGHGNGVRRSDISEENYMRRVFGSRSSEVPLVSVKPIYGHTLGASSALNVAAATLMVNHDFVVPTINIDAALVKRTANHMAGRGEARRCEHGLAVSYGMGGQNAVVLVSKRWAA